MVSAWSLVALVGLVVDAARDAAREKAARERVRLLRLPPSGASVAVVSRWRTVMNGTARMPSMLYGTAYKRHSTADAVERALRAGFVGVDTATAEGGRYNDSGVGEALRRVLAPSGPLKRDDIFVQLKIHHVPRRGAADPSASASAVEEEVDVARRVGRAFRHGLSNLGVERVDALLLRGPSEEARESGILSKADVAAWREMHRLKTSEGGRIGLLGVVNFPPRLLEQLFALDDGGLTPPGILQARCDAESGWARAARDYCAAKGIIFQAPSLLTSNRNVLDRGRAVQKIAFSKRASSERVLLRFALHLGIVPVLGPSSPRHIKDDLAAVPTTNPVFLTSEKKRAAAAAKSGKDDDDSFSLDAQDLATIERETLLLLHQKGLQKSAGGGGGGGDTSSSSSKSGRRRERGPLSGGKNAAADPRRDYKHDNNVGDAALEGGQRRRRRRRSASD